MPKRGGEFFLSWPEAWEAGVQGAGGKGWNLARLARYGFNVPHGGVVAVAAYRHFLAENNLQEETADVGRGVTVADVGTQEAEDRLSRLRERIMDGRVPEVVQEELFAGLGEAGILDQPVAVRSSAAGEDAPGASFAGMHDSFLNVRGRENILAALKACYASLWTPRAMAYRRKMDVPDEGVLPAVVIMAMVAAVAAGVTFTCDPRTGRPDAVVINANFGLGESVVGGTVEPDEYRLNRMFEITGIKVGSKKGRTVAKGDGGTEFVPTPPAGQVLSRTDMARLGRLVVRIFDALGRGEEHQDVEWAFDGRDFALVQARPVTVLPRYTPPALAGQPDVWSNANYRDAVPFVFTTLGWSMMRIAIEGMLFAHVRAAGYHPAPGLLGTRLFGGRAYMNLSLMQWLFYDAFGFSPRMTNENLGGHQPEIDVGGPSAPGVRLARSFRLLRLVMAIQKARRGAAKTFAAMNALTHGQRNPGYAEIYERLWAGGRASVAFSEEYMLLSGLAAPAQMRLVTALERHFPGRGNAVANALMAGAADITSAVHGWRLVEMAQTARGDEAARRFLLQEPFSPLDWEAELPEDSPFKKALRAFLADFGHRGVYEMEIANPRWREDPSYVLNVVRTTWSTADLGAVRAAQGAKKAVVRREIAERVPWPRRLVVNYWLGQALAGAQVRESAKSVLAGLVAYTRGTVLDAGRRLVDAGILTERDDVFHCTIDEIVSIMQGEWDGTGLALLVAERKVRRREMEAAEPPDLIIDGVPRFAAPAAPAGAAALTGIGVAAGRASGPVRILASPLDGEKLAPGDVLVAPSTEPAWTPLFLRAAAIVMETGGVNSHGAIVAREYGIPAVANIPGVLKILADGQTVAVDGDAGKVYIETPGRG